MTAESFSSLNITVILLFSAYKLVINVVSIAKRIEIMNPTDIALP